MYEGKCNCCKNYIGENYRNNEHCEVKIQSQQSTFIYFLKIPRKVPNEVWERKIHEAYYIMCLRPTQIIN